MYTYNIRRIPEKRKKSMRNQKQTNKQTKFCTAKRTGTYFCWRREPLGSDNSKNCPSKKQHTEHYRREKCQCKNERNKQTNK
jgi:hypothetical protein